MGAPESPDSTSVSQGWLPFLFLVQGFLIWCGICHLSECKFLGLASLLLVGETFPCHVALLVTSKTLPFLSISGLVFFYVCPIYISECWFVYIHGDIGPWIAVIGVSCLPILFWRWGLPLKLLWPQHGIFPVSFSVFSSCYFFPFSHDDGFHFSIKGLSPTTSNPCV